MSLMVMPAPADATLLPDKPCSVLIYKKIVDVKNGIGIIRGHLRDGSVVESTGVENRRRFTPFKSSNLYPSAKLIQKIPHRCWLICYWRVAENLFQHQS